MHLAFWYERYETIDKLEACFNVAVRTHGAVVVDHVPGPSQGLQGGTPKHATMLPKSKLEKAAQQAPGPLSYTSHLIYTVRARTAC
jgi:hypothetical protein